MASAGHILSRSSAHIRQVRSQNAHLPRHQPSSRPTRRRCPSAASCWGPRGATVRPATHMLHASQHIAMLTAVLLLLSTLLHWRLGLREPDSSRCGHGSRRDTTKPTGRCQQLMDHDLCCAVKDAACALAVGTTSHNKPPVLLASNSPGGRRCRARRRGSWRAASRSAGRCRTGPSP